MVVSEPPHPYVLFGSQVGRPEVTELQICGMICMLVRLLHLLSLTLLWPQSEMLLVVSSVFLCTPFL